LKNIFKRKRKHRIQKAFVAIINQVFILQIGLYGAFLIDENGHLVDEWDPTVELNDAQREGG